MGISGSAAGDAAAKGAGEAGKGAAEAGAGAEAGADAAAGAGLAGTSAGLGSGVLAGAGAGDAALAAGDVAGSTLADLGAGSALGELGAGGGVLADVGTTAALGTGADLAGGATSIGGAGSTSSAILPEQTVFGTAPGGAAAGGSPLGGLINAVGPATGAGATAALAAGGAGGGGSGVPGAVSQPAGISSPNDLSASNDIAAPGSITDAGSTFIPPYSAPTSLADPSSFGIDTMQPDLANPSFDASTAMNQIDYAPVDQGGGLSGIGDWFENPKNAGTVGLLGLSLKNALSQPKLPGALSTAGNNATQATQGALGVINSGGTASPEWSSQKASIDATINQQITQQTEAIKQAAASSGEGNQNSGLVQQQIAQMTANVNVQRQQLYAQAQQQNVQAALAELSGGDQILTQIGATQLQQSEQAQALAAQTAEMALMLQSGGTMKIPGAGTATP